MRYIFIIFILLLQHAHAVELENDPAVIEPRKLAHNNKIALLTYKPDYIYRYTGTYEYQAHIKFAPGEVVKTVSMGDTSGWEMNPNGNRLFLRPKNTRAKTNMTLITNKRLYQFILDAKSAKSMDDPAVLFEVRFQYPEDNASFTILEDNNDDGIDFSDPSKYNYNYSFSGPEHIAPLKIFDDGEFTYFEFPDKNAEIPAIFYVDADGYEGLVNYRVKNNYIIVERLAPTYTLRHGTDTICVFNELMKNKQKKI